MRAAPTTEVIMPVQEGIKMELADAVASARLPLTKSRPHIVLTCLAASTYVLEMGWDRSADAV